MFFILLLIVLCIKDTSIIVAELFQYFNVGLLFFLTGAKFIGTFPIPDTYNPDDDKMLQSVVNKITLSYNVLSDDEFKAYKKVLRVFSKKLNE